MTQTLKKHIWGGVKVNTNNKKKKQNNGARLSRKTRKAPAPPAVIRIETKKLNRDALSGKIQWLLDFAGSRDVMDAVMDHLSITGKKLVRTEKRLLKKSPKNTLLFNTRDDVMGHWMYFDSKGREWNSYTLDHQRNGSNQFCQSFTLIYMIRDYCAKTKTCYPWSTFYQQCVPGRLGDNIRVVAAFWRKWFDYCAAIPGMNQWMLSTQFKPINRDYIKENKTLAPRRHFTLIASDTNKITMKLIYQKLDDINLYADQIAKVV